MTPTRKALLLAGLQVLLVLSLGAKLHLDRATRPRFWLKAAPVDPDLPIRGRYVSLALEVPVVGAALPPVDRRPVALQEGAPWPPPGRQYPLHVDLEGGPQGLRARAAADAGRGERPTLSQNARISEAMRGRPEAEWVVTLRDPVPFFIPEGVPDPSLRKPGEELWVEVTQPRQGPLRPIRLGVKQDGRLKVLAL